MIAAYRYLYTKKEETNTTTEQTSSNSMNREETTKLINEIVDKKIKENNEVNNAYLLSEMDKKDAALLVAVRNIVSEEITKAVAPINEKLDKVIKLNNLKTK